MTWTHPSLVRAPIGVRHSKNKAISGSVLQSPQFIVIFENGRFYRGPLRGQEAHFSPKT